LQLTAKGRRKLLCILIQELILLNKGFIELAQSNCQVIMIRKHPRAGMTNDVTRSFLLNLNLNRRTKAVMSIWNIPDRKDRLDLG
jgi:hypothetical protein